MPPVSPHGSRTWEAVRYLANKFLSDAQRKKIKNGMARLQRVPLKALGIEALVAAQEAEIERLKSRVVLLDGKLNLAMHGIPRIEEFEPYRLGNALATQLELPPELEELATRLQAGDEVAATAGEAEAIARRAEGVTSDALVIGVYALQPWIDALPRARLVFCEPLADVARRARTELARVPDPARERIELICTTPLTALLAQGDRRFGWIACLGRFQQLSSLEQVHFLDQAVRKLVPGGTLVLRFPEPSGEGYWTQPGNLRPISLRMLQEALRRLAGSFSMESEAGSLTVVFRKG